MAEISALVMAQNCFEAAARLRSTGHPQDALCACALERVARVHISIGGAKGAARQGGKAPEAHPVGMWAPGAP